MFDLNCTGFSCFPRLQDVTHKVVEAIGTIAGSSLEQTTWLRRNLEVKASPQIVVDGASLDTDVEGVLILLVLLRLDDAVLLRCKRSSVASNISNFVYVIQTFECKTRGFNEFKRKRWIFFIFFHHSSINIFLPCCCCLSVFVDLMLTVMEASNFTPSVYSVHALTLLAEVKALCLCL